MIIGGLDIATTTGATTLKDGIYTTETFVYPHKKKKSILDVDEEKKALDANELGKVFDWFDRVITTWLITNGIELVAIEEPLRTDFQGRKKAVVDTGAEWAGKAVRFEKAKGQISLKTIFKLHGLEALACKVCARLNVPVEFVNQATWRAAFLGNGRPANAKDEAVKACRRMGIAITSVDAAESVGVAYWLDQKINPYGHRRANDLFKPLTPAQKAVREAEKLFKQTSA